MLTAKQEIITRLLITAISYRLDSDCQNKGMSMQQVESMIKDFSEIADMILFYNEPNWIEQKIDCFLSLQDERNSVIEVEQSFEPKIDVMKIVSQLNNFPFFQYESFIYKLLLDYAVLLSDRVENGEEEMIKLFINDGIKELLETMEQCSIKGWCEDEKH